MPKMIRPPTMLRRRPFPGSLSPRTFSTTTPSLSALFNLNGLAHSRESQYLSKERGIPRTEYSSNIHLIRSSEVDPFPNAPGASKHANPEGRHLPQRRGARQATVIASGKANETFSQNNDGVSYQAQNAIEELKIQLRAVLDENARLRAAAIENTTGTQGSISREMLRVLVFLVGSYGLVAFFWPAALPKYTSTEPDEKNIVESNAASLAQIEPAEASIKFSSDSEAVLVPRKHLHEPQRSRKSQNALSFLWA
ncbi:hypothetical protein N0V93_007834 [Gnomoniopsis smithogilvyi]|uniref:Uncharacterized protein n=1 Tax=Gnomoniopsis smithogilvyi TaxID=1191159 RepID=A0A9W8YKL3_9PEZI|nr:hypothetical protein N0V93_007834 [Gnomoniopsis smithogilvyi]